VSNSPTQFKLARVERDRGPIAVVTIDNNEDHTKPTSLGRAALESLAVVLDVLEGEHWAGLLLTGKPFVFCAGADIGEFPNVRTPEQAIEGSRAGHELFSRLRALPYPTLAAINGACLGGGVELALNCDWRTISTGVRHFAAPEVALGIIPAWGGTQLVPRLLGAEIAVKFMVESPLRQNRMLDGAKAFELGFADALLEPVEFVDESLRFLLEKLDGGKRDTPAADLSDAAEVVRKARSRVDDQVHGAAPAPYEALDLIAGAATWTLEEGFRAEEEAVGRLMPAPEAQASVYAFDLIERRVKQGVGIPDAKPRKIEKVGIAGAGLMARQLAALFLKRLEVPVVMRDLEQGIVDEAIEFVQNEQRKDFLKTIVGGGTDWSVFEGCDLVLEAVFEELSVKREVFAEVEAVVSSECILATNTSSLSVADMAAELAHPERLVGMHFFNPVAVLPLVELVRAPETDDVTLATAWDVSKKLRKRGVLVKDAPGFVVNRLLTRMTAVLMDALEHGNTVEETDEAALRIGIPMAPSVLLQVVGPRIALHTLETMHGAYPERFPLSETLSNYADGREDVVVRGDNRRSVEELHEAILNALADEIRHLLDEGVVGEAADVDTCLILGAGFPLFRGGITRYLESSGRVLAPA
jgi:3-hydroxyacyl-CoA dehydrogenase/enoyl-CoA hydratase/carnithine racemase